MTESTHHFSAGQISVRPGLYSLLHNSRNDNMDDIENLVYTAHDLYNEFSIFEVIDSDRKDAINKIIEHYGPQDLKKIEKYLTIINKIKVWEESNPDILFWG